MMKKVHSIPTFLGIILLIIGVAVGVFYVQTRQTFDLSASPQETPKEVRVTNVDDASFAVSWTTDKPTFGYVTYERAEALLAADAQKPKSLLHHLTVKDLDPTTSYQFKIGSGENLFDNGGAPYKTKTGPTLDSEKTNDMVFGTVVDKNDKPSSGALVYLTLPGAAPMSTTADLDGSWAYNLSLARTTQLKNLATYTKDAVLEVYVLGDKGQVSTAKIAVSAAKPVPKMVLGENYNFGNTKTIKGDTLPSSDIDFTKDDK
mgnify:FL=1